MSKRVFIKCQECGHYDEVNKLFFVKLIGGAVIGLGWWAWISFLFAGTGFAMAICIAIVAGGAGMMTYSKEITEWVSERYDCPKCGKRSWKMMTDDEMHMEKMNAHLQHQNETLNNDVKSGINDIKKAQDETNKNIKKGFDEVNRKLDSISTSLKFYKEEVTEKLNNSFNEDEREWIVGEFCNTVCRKIEYCFKQERDNSAYCQEEKLLRFTFSTEWDKLEDSTKTFLVTAKVVFNSMSESDAELDYSGVCILVAKAFEVELKKRFFYEFVDYLDDNYHKDYKQWPNALLKGNTKIIDTDVFTLGSVPKILRPREAGGVAQSNLDAAEKRIEEYCKEKLFHTSDINEVRSILHGIACDVNKVKDSYRNPAAHTRMLKIKDAQQCFDDVVDVQKMMINFLKNCNF